MDNYSEEVRRLRNRIQQKQDEIDNYKAEIEEMESDIMTTETEIEELESEIDDQLELAKDAKVPLECYFDELVKRLTQNYEYVIERDEWMIKERFGISDVSFCVILFGAGDSRVTKNVFSSTDPYPTPDSVMTLVQ